MWFSPQHNALIYRPATPLDLVRLCPDAVDLGSGYTAVPARLNNLQRLRAAGYIIVPPLDAQNYDWPRNLRSVPEPWAAQKTMANFMVANPRCFVLSEMRTGKTLSSLWAADGVMRDHAARGLPRARALVVAPLSTLNRTWEQAVFEHFMGRRRAIVLYGDARRRERLLDEDADFYIINHDGLGVGFHERHKLTSLRGLTGALAARTDIRIAIVDECSVYRDPSTRRHKVARHLLAPREYLWMMSGTPTPQGPVDAYGQARLVNNAHGESLTSYRQRVMMQVAQFKWVPRQGSHAEASRLLSPAIRFTQEDCFDVKGVAVIERDAALTPEQTRAYKQLKDHLRLTLKGGKQVNVANEGVLRTKLIQTVSGALYDDNHETSRLDASPRIAVLKELIDEAPKKVIVFAPLTNVLNMLEVELKDYGVVLIIGEVSLWDRSERMAEFQRPGGPRVLLAHPGPIARGNDLTAAATVIWYAPTDKTEDYIQANQRINGAHQTHLRTVAHIVSTPIETEIFHRLEANEGLQGVILKLAEDQ